jgi:hypothetical protein
MHAACICSAPPGIARNSTLALITTPVVTALLQGVCIAHFHVLARSVHIRLALAAPTWSGSEALHCSATAGLAGKTQMVTELTAACLIQRGLL